MAAPLRHQVLETLRNAIVNGDFAPGSRLVERELCERTGVSRTAVREALRQLESEGLVETIANRGPIVARLTKANGIGIYEVREALESLLGGLFAERASDAQVRQLKAIAERLSKAYASGNVPNILKLKAEFYGKIMEGAASPVAEQMFRTILARANALRAISLSQPNRAAASFTEIEAIVNAIALRDREGTERAIRIHVAKAGQAAIGGIDG